MKVTGAEVRVVLPKNEVCMWPRLTKHKEKVGVLCTFCLKKKSKRLKYRDTLYKQLNEPLCLLGFCLFSPWQLAFLTIDFDTVIGSDDEEEEDKWDWALGSDDEGELMSA